MHLTETQKLSNSSLMVSKYYTSTDNNKFKISTIQIINDILLRSKLELKKLRKTTNSDQKLMLRCITKQQI